MSDQRADGRRYAVITPAFNEAEFLPRVAQSMSDQNEEPVAWIVVDDRSTDDTWPVLEKLAREHPWIRPVRRDGDAQRRVGANVVHVFNLGLEHLEKEVDYLVKMDADTLLDADYFQFMMDRFEADPELGMASGKTFIETDEGWMLERIPDTHVSGACKMYRMVCYRAMGGLYPLLGWDILDGAKARMLGYKTRSFRDLPLYHLRQSSSARGMFRGRLRTGRAMYTVRAHPLFVIGKSLYRALEKPYLTGLLIPFGWLLCFFTRPERLADMDLARHLRREQMGRLAGRTRNQEELSVRVIK